MFKQDRKLIFWLIDKLLLLCIKHIDSFQNNLYRKFRVSFLKYDIIKSKTSSKIYHILPSFSSIDRFLSLQRPSIYIKQCQCHNLVCQFVAIQQHWKTQSIYFSNIYIGQGLGQLQQKIKKVIQKSMDTQSQNHSNSHSFQIGQLVWAKITGYPWWPAKVTSIMHKRQPTLRVDFVADCSHAFLTASKLLSYEDGRNNYHQLKKVNKHLQKAFHIAEKQYSMSKLILERQISKENLVNRVVVLQNKLENCREASIKQEKKNEEIMQEESDEDSSINLGQNKEKLTKKEKNVLKEKLIQKLLSKYKLLTIPKINETEKVNKISKVKIIKKQHKEDKKEMAIIKIYSFLKEKDLSIKQKQEIAVKLGNRVIQYGGNRLNYLRHLYRWIKISDCNIIYQYHSNWENFYKINDDIGSHNTLFTQSETMGNA